MGICPSISTRQRRPTQRRRGVALSQRNERVLFALGICGLVILGGFIAYVILAFLASVPIFTFAVIGAVFFAYLIHPIVAWLQRRMPMVAAILVLYLAIALLVAFVLYIISPLIAADAKRIMLNAPKLVSAGRRLLTDPHDPLTAHLPPHVRSLVASIPVRVADWLTQYASSLAKRAMPLVLSFVTVVAMFVIIPVTAAYMTAEARTIKRTLLALLPPSARMRTARIISDLDSVVGGFIRGQLLVACVVGSLVTLLLLGLHVPYAFLIGLFAGVADVIPYVGAVAGWLPAFLIAYMNNGFPNAIAVSLGIIVINQLEGHIIVPNVVSRTVALTPLGILLSLLLAGEVLGLPGLLIAVPAAGVVRVLVINFTNWPRHEPRKPIIPRPLQRLPRLLVRLILRHQQRG